MKSVMPDSTSSRCASPRGVALALLLALQPLAASVSVAGTPINESRPVGPQALVEIANVRGAVNVSVWERNEVSITGTLGDGSKGLAIEGGGDRLRIKVQAPDRQGWFNWGGASMQDSILDVRVPKGSSLGIDVVSATVDVSGIEGRELKVDTVSGKVRLDSRARELSVDSVSGSVEMNGHAEEGSFESVSGNIRVKSSGGEFSFDTVSGDIDADLQGYREFKAGTVSGDVRLRGQGAARMRVEVETMSGDVTLNLPADLAGRLEAETFSGRLRSDFGTVKQPERGPGRSIDAVLGSGDARVTVETFSGDIEIRRQ